MLLCTVLFMPSPALGGVPSAPGDVAGAIGAASAENGSSALAEKSLAHTELVRNPSAHNPSQLVKQRPDSKDCTHVLFRMPKTGSTALFNAAQEDDALHAHVCSDGQRNPVANKKSGQDVFPQENMTQPILVSVRRPEELWSSHVRYSNWKTGAVHELVDALPGLSSGKGRDLYGRWVLRRHGHGDIYLCIGMGMPEMRRLGNWPMYGKRRLSRSVPKMARNYFKRPNPSTFAVSPTVHGQLVVRCSFGQLHCPSATRSSAPR